MMVETMAALLLSSGALETSRFHQLSAGAYRVPRSVKSASRPVVPATSANEFVAETIDTDGGESSASGGSWEQPANMTMARTAAKPRRLISCIGNCPFQCQCQMLMQGRGAGGSWCVTGCGARERSTVRRIHAVRRDRADHMPCSVCESDPRSDDNDRGLIFKRHAGSVC